MELAKPHNEYMSTLELANYVQPGSLEAEYYEAIKNEVRNVIITNKYIYLRIMFDIELHGCTTDPYSSDGYLYIYA